MVLVQYRVGGQRCWNVDGCPASRRAGGSCSSPLAENKDGMCTCEQVPIFCTDMIRGTVGMFGRSRRAMETRPPT